MTTTELPLTACPSWCELPHGHEWTVRPDQVDRTHKLTVADLQLFESDWVTVSIDWYEFINTFVPDHVPPEVPPGDREPLPVSITINDLSDSYLTADDARQIAGALLKAADQLDEINGSRS